MKSYLVQRALIKTMDRKLITGIDSLLDYDYMGSAEFEFGTLSASFRRICADLKDYTVVDTKLSLDSKRPLFLTCKEDEQKEAIEELRSIIKNDRQLKESAYLKEALDGTALVYKAKINVWWDVENDWIAHLSNRTNRDLVLFALREAAKRRKEKKE